MSKCMSKAQIKAYLRQLAGDISIRILPAVNTASQDEFDNVIVPITTRAMSYYLYSLGTCSYTLARECRAKAYTAVECLALILKVGEVGDEQDFIENTISLFHVTYDNIRRTLEDDYCSLDYAYAIEELTRAV